MECIKYQCAICNVVVDFRQRHLKVVHDKEPTPDNMKAYFVMQVDFDGMEIEDEY